MANESLRGVLIAATIATAIATAPASAQTAAVLDLRVGKLEKEMKAVQRTVFPNGVAIEPEIGAAVPTSSGNLATAPIADLTARVDALEAQLKTLTGQSEQDGFRIKKLEEGLNALRSETDARLKILETGTTAPTAAVGGEDEASAKPTPIVATAKPATPVAKPAVAKPAAAKPVVALKPDPARKEKIAAVEVPSSGDSAEDAYSYGYRLWTAKLYPEAQVKLKEYVAKHGGHKRESFARNLLGRAYYDEGKPALASVAFYDNYQKLPRGERAPESLYWLGMSLTRLKKPVDACKVYTEFAEVYSASASSDLKARVAKGRADAKCTT